MVLIGGVEDHRLYVGEEGSAVAVASYADECMKSAAGHFPGGGRTHPGGRTGDDYE
ncbi:hypothetical protein GCM10010431_55880 [Streptomyces kunmingensis]